jgi:two-component system LytT family response regulator
MEMVGECGTGQEAEAMIKAERPDLLFLDVRLPEMNGFDVLSGVASEQMPAVIFIAAYSEYAVKAFEFDALDYLLKPFTDERIQRALSRAKAHIEGRWVNEVNQQLMALVESIGRQETTAVTSTAPRPYRERLMVKSGGRVRFLNVREVEWIEAADYYVQVHVGDRSQLLREAIASLEAQLDPNMFLRIHRSTLVNIARVKELKPHSHGNCQLILCDGTVLEMSRRRRERLKSSLERFA